MQHESLDRIRSQHNNEESLDIIRNIFIDKITIDKTA